MNHDSGRYSPDTVYVYWLHVRSSLPVRAQYALLSEDERERASHFRFERDRLPYVYARASLRRLIGKALDADPASLVFSYAAFGKPSLDNESRAPVIEFNVSHTADLAVIALSLGRKVGVDVEHPVTDLDMRNIAQRAFSVTERTALNKLSEVDRTRAFFRCWTRKEAYLKMLGEGLGYPTGHFSVLLDEISDDALIHDELVPDIVEKVRVRNLECPAGYIAAIALDGRDWKLEVFDGND